MKERRYASTLLTIVLRDFTKVLTGNKNVNTLQSTLSQIWNFSLKNLVYILPFYVDRILYPFADSIQIED